MLKARPKFRHVALIGKYHASSVSMRETLLDLSQFLHGLGMDVSFDAESTSNLDDKDIEGHALLSLEQIGQQCDLALVVGGDGTMLGIGRRLAPFGIPLIGINHGRLGFITDIALNDYKNALQPMLRGEYAQELRPLMQARVMHNGPAG